MRLISEITENIAHSTIIDESTGTKTSYIEGIFAQAELTNRNRRVYPRPILEKAIGDYNKNYVTTRRALGALNHPNSPQVDPEQACILIEKLEWEGNNVIGRAKVLSTPKGKIVEALIHDNVQLGVSTRGLGSIRKTRINNEDVSVVEPDYEIRAIDVVHNPSGIDCFVNGILENTEFYYNNGVLCEREIEEIREHVQKNDVSAIMSDFRKVLGRI